MDKKRRKRSAKPRGWDALLEACASGLTLPKAAEAVGVTPRTAYAHHSKPEFQRELAATRGRAVGQLATRGVQVALLGLDFLEETIRAAKPGDAQAVRAALGALDKAGKLHELADVLPQLAELREAVERMEAANGTN